MPSCCCFRSARGPSPAADEVGKSRTATITRRRRRRPVMEERRQTWNPFAGVVRRYIVNVALAECLAREFERRRRRWFGFGQPRRLVAEAKGKARAGAPPCHVGRRRSRPSGCAVAPLVEEEEMVSAPAAAPVVKEKTLFPPGGYNTQCKPPARITRADRCGPGSLEAFLESVVAARGTGGAGESTAQGVRLRGSRWAEITEAKARRQRYLRDYCPFQREDEEEEEISPATAPEKKTKDGGEGQQQQQQEEVAGHAVAEQPASCPAPEGGDDDDDDATGVRDRQARPVRGTTEYNVMRQEFLRSYSFGRRTSALRLPLFGRLLQRRR